MKFRWDQHDDTWYLLLDTGVDAVATVEYKEETREYYVSVNLVMLRHDWTYRYFDALRDPFFKDLKSAKAAALRATKRWFRDNRLLNR